VTARQMTNSSKRFPAYGTTALWATAVWGSKPAPNPNTPLELPGLWDSSTAWALSARGCSARASSIGVAN
jgi:hypothetical protein